MIHLKKIAFVFLILSATLISGCSKYKIYNMAVDGGRSSAGLVVKKVNISIGEIVYLDNSTGKNARQDQEVVIMVHGFGANKDSWVRLSDEMTDDYRILALDLPGHGDSIADLSNSYTVENQAKWLNEFMETLQITKAHVIGNSMGGAISVKMTHLYPQKIISMTLVDSAGAYKTESEFFQLLKKGINPLIVDNFDDFQHLLDFVMADKPYIPGPVLEVLAEKKIARQAIDEKIFQDIRTDMDSVGELLSGLHAPTLIIWGDKDRILHVDNADEFHRRIQGSQKVVFEGVGHVPMIEDPKKTGDHYLRFLSSIVPE